MGCCNNKIPSHKPHHKPQVPCPDNYVDVSRIDPKEYEEIALLLGMNDCGFIYPVKKSGKVEMIEVDGNGDKALFDDGTYKEVLTKDEVGEYVKMSMEDFVQYTSTDDVELRNNITIKNAASYKATNTSGNKFNVGKINQDDEIVLGDTALQTVIESLDRPVVRTYTNPGLRRAAFESRVAYLSDVDANAGKIDEVKTDLSALEGRVTTNESDINALKGRVTTNEGKIDDLEIQSGDHEIRIVELEMDVDANIDDIDALKGRVTTNEGNITGLQTKTGDHETRIGTLEGDVSTNKTDISALDGRVTVNEADIAGLKTKTADNASKIADLKTDVTADLSALDGRITTNTTNIAINKTAIDNLRDDVAAKEHFRGYFMTTTEITALSNPDTGDFAYNAQTGTKWAYNGVTWADTLSLVPDKTVEASDLVPVVDEGNGKVGTSVKYARADHAHPTDLTRASVADLTATNLEVTSVKTDLSTFKTSTSQKIQDLEAKDTALKAGIDANADDIADFESELDAFKDATGQNLQDINSKIQANTQAIGQNATNIAANATDIAGIKEDLSKTEHFRGYYPTSLEILSIANPKTGDFAYSAETGTKWIYSNGAWSNSGVPVPDKTVEGADTVPNMDKPTGETGISNKYARADHVHPSDATKANKTDLNSYLPLAGNTQATRMDGDIWLGSDHKVRLSNSGNSYIGLDSDGQKVEITNTGIGGIDLNVPAGTVKINGNEVLSYDSQNDINAKNNITIKTGTKLQGTDAANKKVNLIGIDHYGNIEAGSTDDKFVIATNQRPTVKEGNETKSVAYVEDITSAKAELKVSIDANDIAIKANKVQIETNASEIAGIKEDLAKTEHFRGYFKTTIELTNVPNSRMGDFAYCVQTGTKWIYNGTTLTWEDTGIDIPIETMEAFDGTPSMDGTAFHGNSNLYSRGDHVHPTDTTRASSTALETTKQDLTNLSTIVTNNKTSADTRMDGIDTRIDGLASTVSQHGTDISEIKTNVVPQVETNKEDISDLKDEIANIPQANWTEADQNAKSFIRNKPDLSIYATKTQLDSEIANIPQANWTETDDEAKSFILNKPTLGTMAAEDKDDYVTATDFSTALGNKVTSILAGDNIKVETNGDVTQPKVSVTGVVTKVTAGANVSVTGTDKEPVVSVELPEKFISSESIEGSVGTAKTGLSYAAVQPIISGSVFGINDVVIFSNGVHGEVVAYDDQAGTYNVVIVQVPEATVWGAIGGTLANQTDLQTELNKKANSADVYSKTDADTLLNNKVDKEAGKGLSTNDFDNAYKTKVDGIEDGAQKNVQSDWNQEDRSEDDFIHNKPTTSTETTEGLIRIATATEVEAGTGINTAVTPANLKTAIDNAISKAIQDGNYRIADTIAGRDALTATEGLLCYVKANDLIYYHDGTQWIEWKSGLQLDPGSKNVSVSEDGLLIENNYVIVEDEAARDALPKYEGLHVYTKKTGGGSSTEFSEVSPVYTKGIAGATTNLAGLPVDNDGYILDYTNNKGIKVSDIKVAVADVGQPQFPADSRTEGNFTEVHGLDSYCLTTQYVYSSVDSNKFIVSVFAWEKLFVNQFKEWKICEYEHATGIITMKDDAAIADLNEFIREHNSNHNIETRSKNSYTDSIWAVTINWMPINAVGSAIRPTNISEIKGIRFSANYLKYYMSEMTGYPDPLIQWNGGADYIRLYKSNTELWVQSSIINDRQVAAFDPGITNVANFSWQTANIDDLNAQLDTYFASHPTGAITQIESSASANRAFLFSLGSVRPSSTLWTSSELDSLNIRENQLYINNWLPMDSLGRGFAIQDAEGKDLVLVDDITNVSDTLEILLVSISGPNTCKIAVDAGSNSILDVQGDLMTLINESLAYYGKTFEEAKPIQVVNYPAGFTGGSGTMPIPGGDPWDGNIDNIAAQPGGSVGAQWNSQEASLEVHYTDNTTSVYTLSAVRSNGNIQLSGDNMVIWTGYTSQTTPTEMGGTLIGQSGDLRTALVNDAAQYGKTISWALLESYPATDTWLVLKGDSSAPDNWLYSGTTTTLPERPKMEYWNGTQWIECKSGLQLDPDSKNVSVTEDGLLIENNYVVVDNEAARDALAKYEGLHVYTKKTGGGSVEETEEVIPEYISSGGTLVRNLAALSYDGDRLILGEALGDVTVKEVTLWMADVGTQMFPAGFDRFGENNSVYSKSYRMATQYSEYATDENEYYVEVNDKTNTLINRYVIGRIQQSTGVVTYVNSDAINEINALLANDGPYFAHVYPINACWRVTTDWLTTFNYMYTSDVYVGGTSNEPSNMSEIGGIKFSKSTFIERNSTFTPNTYIDYLLWMDGAIQLYADISSTIAPSTTLYIIANWGGVRRTYPIASFNELNYNVANLTWNDTAIEEFNQAIAAYLSTSPNSYIEFINGESTYAQGFLIGSGSSSREESTYWTSSDLDSLNIRENQLYTNNWLPMDSLGRGFAIQDAEGNTLVYPENITEVSDTLEILLVSISGPNTCKIAVDAGSNSILDVQGDLMTLINDSLAHYGKTFEEAKPIQVVNYPAGFTGGTGSMPIQGTGWEGIIEDIAAQTGGSVSTEWNAMTDYTSGAKLTVTYTDRSYYDYTFVADPANAAIKLYWDGMVIWTGYTSQRVPPEMGGTLVSQSKDLKTALIDSAIQYGKTIDWGSMAILQNYPATDNWLVLKGDSSAPDNWLYSGTTTTLPVRPKMEYWNGTQWIECKSGLQLDPDSKNVSVTEDGLLIENNYVVVDNEAALNALTKYDGLTAYVKEAQSSGGSTGSVREHNLGLLEVDEDNLILGTLSGEAKVLSAKVHLRNVGETLTSSNEANLKRVETIYISNTLRIDTEYVYNGGNEAEYAINIRAINPSTGSLLASYKIGAFKYASGIITEKYDQVITEVNNFIASNLTPTSNIVGHRSAIDAPWVITTDYINMIDFVATKKNYRGDSYDSPRLISEIRGVKFSPSAFAAFNSEITGAEFNRTAIFWDGNVWGGISLVKSPTSLSALVRFNEQEMSFPLASFEEGTTLVSNYTWHQTGIEEFGNACSEYFEAGDKYAEFTVFEWESYRSGGFLLADSGSSGVTTRPKKVYWDGAKWNELGLHYDTNTLSLANGTLSAKIPSNVSSLNNDSGYVTSATAGNIASNTVNNALTNYYTKAQTNTQISNAISNIATPTLQQVVTKSVALDDASKQVLNAQLNSGTIVTSVASLNPYYMRHIATISADATIGFANNVSTDITVFIRNTSAAGAGGVRITIPTSIPGISTVYNFDDATISIPPGKYAEVSFLVASNTCVIMSRVQS